MKDERKRRTEGFGGFIVNNKNFVLAFII